MIRARILFVIASLLCFLLVINLFRLQVVQGSHYQYLGERNRIRVAPIPAARGQILDRKGRVLATTRPAFSISVIRDQSTPEALQHLASLSRIPLSYIQEALEKSRETSFLPTQIERDVDPKIAFQIEEQGLETQGILVEVEPIRDYPWGPIASHVLGYVSYSDYQATPVRTYGLSFRKPFGIMGVEETFQKTLEEEMGGEQVEVDNRGQRRKTLGYKVPREGQSIRLTIDLELNRLAQETLSGHRGAIVVLDPRTGDILALVSEPSFDPNIFANTGKDPERKSLLTRQDLPLFNRAIQGQYPPASTFKTISALVALEEKSAYRDTLYTCHGSYAVGNRLFHCWRHTGHGQLNLVQAIQYSCNVYFYQLGLNIGPEGLTKGARMMGLGKATGIQLKGESSGLVPSVRWKRANYQAGWFHGETAHFAIGQGYLLVTPLQVARYTSVFANGGRLITPNLVYLAKTKNQALRVRPKNLSVLQEGLFQVVNAEDGTGTRARVPSFQVSGKTGTAEVSGKKPHAWFCGFAPTKDPRFTVVVLIEHGGKGSQVPAEIAGKLFNWLKDYQT